MARRKRKKTYQDSTRIATEEEMRYWRPHDQQRGKHAKLRPRNASEVLTMKPKRPLQKPDKATFTCVACSTRFETRNMSAKRCAKCATDVNAKMVKECPMPAVVTFGRQKGELWADVQVGFIRWCAESLHEPERSYAVLELVAREAG